MSEDRNLSRIQMLIARGTLARVDDAQKMQAVQIELLADETHEGVEHFQPYGFNAHPLPGAEVLAVAPGGIRSASVVLAIGDRRYRMTGMAAGEVALHDDQGQCVHIARDGIRIVSVQGVTIETEGDLTMTAQGAIAIEAEGDLTMTGANVTTDCDGTVAVNSDDVTIGNGAVKGAARVDDAIHDGDDRISSGSSKVKIG